MNFTKLGVRDIDRKKKRERKKEREREYLFIYDRQTWPVTYITYSFKHSIM